MVIASQIESFTKMIWQKLKALALSPLLWIVLIVFLIWSGSYLYIRSLHNDLSESGQVGDTFGAVNALFSGLAFAGVVYTLLIQQREVKRNSSIQHRERFEVTFFKMIELQNSITSSLSRDIYLSETGLLLTNYPPKETKLTGKSVVAEELKDLKEFFIANLKVPLDKPAYKDSYDRYDQSIRNKYDNYLTNIQLIYEFILGHNQLTPDDKYFYLRLFAFQLSEQELAFFFYYYTLSEEKTKADNHTLNANPDLDLMAFVNKAYLVREEHFKFYDPEFDAK